MVDADPLKYAVPIPVYLLTLNVLVEADPENTNKVVEIGGLNVLDFAAPERTVINPDPT